jgi:hypothetical protein
VSTRIANSCLHLAHGENCEPLLQLFGQDLVAIGLFGRNSGPTQGRPQRSLSDRRRRTPCREFRPSLNYDAL